jgi:hypothetical protein
MVERPPIDLSAPDASCLSETLICRRGGMSGAWKGEEADRKERGGAQKNSSRSAREARVRRTFESVIVPSRNAWAKVKTTLSFVFLVPTYRYDQF